MTLHCIIHTYSLVNMRRGGHYYDVAMDTVDVTTPMLLVAAVDGMQWSPIWEAIFITLCVCCIGKAWLL